LIHQVPEAVDVLVKHKLHREALTLAKARLPFSLDLHDKLAKIFARVSTSDGHYDMGALL